MGSWVHTRVCLTGHRLCVFPGLDAALLLPSPWRQPSTSHLHLFLGLQTQKPSVTPHRVTEVGHMAKVAAVWGKTRDEKSGWLQSDILDFCFFYKTTGW